MVNKDHHLGFAFKKSLLRCLFLLSNPPPRQFHTQLLSPLLRSVKVEIRKASIRNKKLQI